MQVNAKIVGLVIIGMLVTIGFSFGLSYHFLNKKVAYVRSQDLIYQYEGTKEAMAKFNNQKEQWQAIVDTLKLDFSKAIAAYKNDYANMSQKDRAMAESKLEAKEMQLTSYSKAMEERINDQDTKSMQEVLNQINGFIEEYSLKNDYEIVMGTTRSGSVLYGNDALDITEEILEEMNKNYLGE